MTWQIVSSRDVIIAHLFDRHAVWRVRSRHHYRDVSAFLLLMRSIRWYVDRWHGRKSTGLHKETRRPFDRFGVAKTTVSFYYQMCLSSESVSRKFVIPFKMLKSRLIDSFEIQVNRLIWMDNDEYKTLIRRNCCFNVDVIKRY